MCSKKRKKVLTFIHFIRKMEFGKKELVQEKKNQKTRKIKKSSSNKKGFTLL